MKKKALKRATSTMVLMMATVAPSVTSAQSESESTERSARLSVLNDTLVVTARKREENAQDAPVSISAFSGEGLDMRGFQDLSEIGQIVPNLNYQNNPGPSGSSSVATVYIRGIGQRDFLGTIDNGVGFYIDDVVVSRTIGAIVDLVDIERIEVLRGPQGTLFGRNNVGGALKIHTREPGDELGGYIDAQYGTDNLFRVKGKVDLPVSDELSFNFAALYGRQDGYVPRTDDINLGNEEVYALRGSAVFTPNDRFKAFVTVSYSDEEDNGAPYVLVDPGTTVGFPAFHNNVIAAADCAFPSGITSPDPACYNSQWNSTDQSFGTAPSISKTKSFNATAKLEYEINDALVLTSVTGYRELDAEFARDGDGSPHTISEYASDFDSSQFSQELQLAASLLDGKLEWISGLYYFDESGVHIDFLDFAISRFLSGADFGTESKAIFSQATFNITDRLYLTLGGRWTDEDKTFLPDQFVQQSNTGLPFTDNAGNCVSLNVGANNANNTPGLTTPLPNAACPLRLLPFEKRERQTQDFTPMVNLSYAATDDLLLYAAFSQGFRSGGYVQRVFPPLPEALDFEPEFVDSYEIGAKFQAGSLTLNGAAFYTDYTDIQVRSERPGFVGRLESNVGDARIWGIELESRFTIGESLFVEVGYGYTNAEFTAIRVEPPLTSEVAIDDEFDHVPEHSISGSLIKEVNLGSAGDLVGRFDVSHTTEYPNDPDNSPLIFTPEVTLLGANLRWISPDDRISVSVIGKNLTDERYILTGFHNESIGPAMVVLDRGRQILGQVRLNF